ncbi:methyl-accepting chemotaxis sensory transducer with Pas/Pac sensor [Candidatus Vecturithrix granuli]|uniref:Methyl-accepting chemotaxis sensory transducer with Pas/Pac sensor n=1 Tax=Vecturithrix granuli TaxID=1499967 RepID=A0A081BWK4_VECG1|nr:methyl-accepting chemotaxis sensory transducer with Pas/Pac sensor [Candidatus Vecturithrix granuli]
MQIFSEWSISTKLLLLNMLIFLIISGIIVIVFLSFNDIERMMTQMVNKDVSQAIENGRIGRELTTLFADTSNLVARFLDQHDLLTTEGPRLIESATALLAHSTNPRLQQTLQDFIQQFQTFLDQATVVSRVSQDVRRSDEYLEARLQELESTIRNTAITIKMEGRNVAELERLGYAVPRYHETLLRVNSAFSDIIQTRLRIIDTTSSIDDEFLQILLKLDEWEAELQPLLTSEPAVYEIGETLIDTVRSHKEIMTAFYKELAAFQEHLQAISDIQHQVLAVMENIDTEIQQTTTRMKNNIHETVSSSQRLALIASGVILIVILVGWWGIRWMTRPLLQVSHIAEQLAEGDIECDITRVRRRASADEVGILSRSFSKLITYIQEMSKVAQEIANGNLSRLPHPRSARDVLGHAFLEMSNYLNDMASTATAIAKGDLRREVAPKTENDVLGNAFQQMSFLRNLVSEIMTGSSQLLRASEELSQISTQMASLTEQTSQQAYMVSANSKQISENVDAVATSTEQLSANIHEISNHTEKVSHIANIAADLTISTVSVIADLETRSQEIGEIIEVITDVTQQTNLLALNATIEAARAGDAGRGFAVVAHEIKELSRETAASTEDIIQKLEAIKVSSGKATSAISKVSEIVAQIRDLANSTASGVEEQSVTTHDIACRMGETAKGSQDITRVVSEVATAAYQSSEGVIKIQSAAEELASLAERLQRIIEEFKV